MRQMTHIRLGLITCALALPLYARAADIDALPDISSTAMPPEPGVEAAAMSASPKAIPTSNAVLLEEGRTLFENGQYLAALNKFMQILRREPQNPDARRYLRLVVDVMRKNPTAMSTHALGGRPGQAIPSQAVVNEQVRRVLQQRQLLTWDLKAIPGVRLIEGENQVQVQMDTALIFGDNSGGLKEGAIPLLDRIAAWLKTFGRQAVVIHCYPEENQSTEVGGSLFLKRYSALYSFFVEERRMPAGRFISANLLKSDGSSPVSSDDMSVAMSSRPMVVIEALGGRSNMQFLTDNVKTGQSNRWLEFSILTSRKMVNPEEGEWASLDLAALTRNGLRSWSFFIMPDSPKAKQTPVMKLEGQGNLLQRVSWDGRDLGGNLVPNGPYICHLIATDSDGYTMKQDQRLEVTRTSQPTVDEAPVLVDKPKAAAPKKKKKKAVVAKAVEKPADALEAPVGAAAPDMPALATAAAPAAEPASDMTSAGDSVQAIWKQVIEFERGESELKASLKSSLERIAKTMEVYPRQKVRIMGFAEAGEPGALAKKRADMIQRVLVEDYHVNPARVINAGGRASGGHKVEISIIN